MSTFSEEPFDELEAISTQAAPETPAPPAAVDYNTIKVEGDSVPESFRGMSAAQVVERAARLEEALRISEQARQTSSAPSAPQVQTPVQDDVPQLSKEKLLEMLEKDPAEAIAMVGWIAKQQAIKEFEQRMAPLHNNSRSSAEFQARQQYAEDFEALGDEIKALAAQTNPAVLSSPEAWDSIVKYARGANIEKLLAHRAKKSQAANQAEQINLLDVPRVPKVNTPPSATVDSHGLDATALKVCEVMGLSPADYKKWSR